MTDGAIPRRVAVSIGGQPGWEAEVVRETRAGLVVREPDGTETLLPAEDIEDGSIVVRDLPRLVWSGGLL